MPDNQISFTPGSGTSLPMVAISTAEEVEKTPVKILKPKAKKKVIPYISPGIPRTPGRSQEWRKLPRQEWENYVEPLPTDDDGTGFDKRSKINFGQRSVVDLPVIVSEDKLDLKGHVEGAITERAFLNLGDEVVLSAEGDGTFQVGDLYAVVGSPNKITASNSDRSAYSYPVYGKIKVTGVRDGVFVASITSLRLHISRGDAILPLPPVPTLRGPTPAAAKQDAVIIKDPFLTPGVVSQQRFAVVDRGSDDGIKGGNIFRAFDYEDRFSGRKLVESDLFPNADFLVAYAWPKFSLVIATRGDDMYENGVAVTLLTDVSDLSQFSGARAVPVFEETKNADMKDLEGLDTTPGIGKKEEEELKELEDSATGKPHEAPPVPEPNPEANTPPPGPDTAAPPPPDLPPDEAPPVPLDTPAKGSGDELDISDTPPASEPPPPN
jgi:hypothetical protein